MISCHPCGGHKRCKQVNGWYLAGKQKGCRAVLLCSTCPLCLKEILPRHFEQLRRRRCCCFPQCKEAGVTNEALCLFSLKKKFPKAQMIMSRRGGRREEGASGQTWLCSLWRLCAADDKQTDSWFDFVCQKKNPTDAKSRKKLPQKRKEMQMTKSPE